jgi:hypothetical protein
MDGRSLLSGCTEKLVAKLHASTAQPQLPQGSNPRRVRFEASPDASYIKRVDEKSVEAMDRLEAELRKLVQSVKGKARKADTVLRVGMA